MQTATPEPDKKPDILAEYVRFALLQSYKKHSDCVMDYFGHQIKLVSTFHADPELDECYYYVDLGKDASGEPVQFDSCADAEAHSLAVILESNTPAEILETLKFLEDA